MKIVYIEDNEELRETIGCLMEGPGRSITCCANAEEALQLDAQAPFDLVVTDVSLPGQSGTELAQSLLKHAPLRWIVLCTGYDLGHYPAQWGPNVRTLLKPFEIEELEALLGQIEAQRPNAMLQ